MKNTLNILGALVRRLRKSARTIGPNKLRFTRPNLEWLEWRLAPANITWTGADKVSPNNWFVGANWAGGEIPGPKDAVIIPRMANGNNPVVPLPVGVVPAVAFANSITIRGGGELTDTGLLFVGVDGVYNSGTLTLDGPNSRLTSRSTANYGRLVFNGGTISGSVSNDAPWDNVGTITVVGVGTPRLGGRAPSGTIVGDLVNGSGIIDLEQRPPTGWHSAT